jgi:thioredoxin-dependent peroxiredoxin
VRKVWMLLSVLAFIALGFLWFGRSSASRLKAGSRAPNFALTDQNGHSVKLSDYLGKKTVVLAFYIKAFTSG